MRVLLSTIGSRGDVQPLAALALHLRTLGQEVRLCVPPDFIQWLEGLGLSATPIGPELRTATPPAASAAPTPEQLRRMAEATVATQFEQIAAAARGCDVIVGATALQIAARSVAEAMASRTSSPPTVPSSCRRRTTRRPRCRRWEGSRRRPTTASCGRGTRSASTRCSAPR